MKVKERVFDTMSELYIDFYRGKDEDTFLAAWENKYGSLSDDDIDELYAEIADAIEKAVKEGTHEVGKPFVYKDVLVGKSDFNTSHSLYIFEQDK